MKKSKRIITSVALAALFGGVALTTVACNSTPAASSTTQTEELSASIKQARSYLKGLYDNRATNTTATFELLNSVPVSGGDVKVVWTVTVTSGTSADVKAEIDEKKNVTKIVINDFAQQETKYTLSAILTDAEGKTGSLEYNYVVPKYKSTSYADWKANCKSGKNVNTVEGYVLGVIGTGSSKGSFYLVDKDGNGYYAYSPDVSQLADDALVPGAPVIVRGTGTVYSGQYEFNKGCTVIAGTGTAKTHDELKAMVKDGTTQWASAKNNKDEGLIDYQNRLVELKGCKAVSVDGSYLYFTIGESTVQYNLYYNTYFQAASEVDAMKEAWINGATFDLVGLVCVYSNAYQVYPIFNKDETLKNYSLPERTDAQKVAVVKDGLKVTTDWKKAGTATLPLKGYANAVTVSWASSNTDLVKVANDGTLTVKLGEAAAEVTLTATITCGTESDTKAFTLKVAKQPVVTVPTTEASLVLDFSTYGLKDDTSDKGYAKNATKLTGDDSVATVEVAKGAGTNDPKFYYGTVRVYAKGTIKVSSSKVITAIRFTLADPAAEGATYTLADITSNTGDLVSPLYNGTAKSVTFTVGASGQYRIEKIEIWLEA